MGRMYVIEGSVNIAGSSVDLFEIVAPSDAIVIIHELVIGQITDEGDANEQFGFIQGSRGYTTSGSGGASLTPVALEAGMPAFGGTAESSNTTVATGGTPSTVLERGFNIRVGLYYVPTPETRIVLSPSQRLVFRAAGLHSSNNVTYDSTCLFEEIGG